MMRRSLRKIALSLLGLLLFAQASVVLSACQGERASPAHMMSAPASEDGCDGCDMTMSHEDYANTCFAHCTSDLQLTGERWRPAPSATGVAVLRLPRAAPQELAKGLDGPAPGAPPRRILFRSFLI